MVTHHLSLKISETKIMIRYIIKYPNYFNRYRNSVSGAPRVDINLFNPNNEERHSFLCMVFIKQILNTNPIH